MPELPEVETFKRYLDKTSLKQEIKEVKVTDTRILDIDFSILKKSVVNKRFEHTVRYGKYLFVFLNPKYLVLHFGMTGDLEYYNNKDIKPNYSKVIFYFDNGYNLAYISRRMFGRVYITDSIEKFIDLKKLGPDAFKMSFEEFTNALKRRTAILKNALLNQSFIAGIGNLYSDEIMFKSNLHPLTKLDEIDDDKIKEIYSNIREILEVGIKKKGDLSKFPNNFIIPHRKKEERCPKCDAELERIEISGRHGYLCPTCQKKKY